MRLVQARMLAFHQERRSGAGSVDGFASAAHVGHGQSRAGYDRYPAVRSERRPAGSDPFQTPSGSIRAPQSRRSPRHPADCRSPKHDGNLLCVTGQQQSTQASAILGRHDDEHRGLLSAVLILDSNGWSLVAPVSAAALPITAPTMPGIAADSTKATGL